MKAGVFINHRADDRSWQGIVLKCNYDVQLSFKDVTGLFIFPFTTSTAIKNVDNYMA